MRNLMHHPLVAGSLLLLLSGCATTPESLQGEFASLRTETATDQDIGETVRWGGNLLEVRPEQSQTCLEVLSRRLEDNGRPDSDSSPGRRFIACRAGFTDPAALPVDRLVTVVGELTGFRNRKIGEYDYRFPVIEISALHLWPKPVERSAYPPPPWWYDPFYPYPYRHYPYW